MVKHSLKPLYRYLVQKFRATTRSGARRRYLHHKFGTRFTRVQRTGARHSSRRRGSGMGYGIR
jgi:hypothetical protein